MTGVQTCALPILPRDQAEARKRSTGSPSFPPPPPRPRPVRQATYLQPPASGSERGARVLPAASLRASPGGGATSQPGRGKTRLVEGESRQEGKSPPGRGRRKLSGCRTAGRSPAPGSPRLQGLFGQKRKRGFSKVEEEPKKAGQTRKEQTRARCEWPRSLERSQRILSKQQPPRINCVCARGGGEPSAALLLATLGAGGGRGLGTGGGALRVRKSLQVREWPGVQD